MKKICLPVLAVITLLSCKQDITSLATTSTDKAASISMDTTSCSSVKSASAKVVCLAEAFMATLSSTQLSGVLFDYTKENAIKWSNLPCGSQCRIGLELNTLSSTQLAAALAVIKAATGTVKNEGYDEITQIRMADDILNAAQTTGTGTTGGGTDTTGGSFPGGTDTTGGGMDTTGGGGGGTPPGDGGSSGGTTYSSGNYFISFLGTPSLTGTWQLQFGGHHLAMNITYSNGEVQGATPSFRGIEPKTWTSGDTTYAPLSREHNGMVNMLAKLNSTQLAAAKLSSTFSDVVLGPDADGQFPTTKQGLAVSALSSAQKKLVLIAMAPWVADIDDETAAKLMLTYASELNNTYIAYSGNTSLTQQADYVRIDGPRVWIEFVCQNGVVYQNQIHYHSVWRDHIKDYGGNFSF